MLLHCGDIMKFSLKMPLSREGSAFLRTNLNNSSVRYNEIINHVEQGRPILSSDWYDIPMERVDDTSFSVDVPLLEVGRFEAKVFFISSASEEPVWPDGGNTVIKVQSASTFCANSIYSAFVRQFGDTKAAAKPVNNELIGELEAAGYEVIPRSGTFRDLIQQLNFITGTLRFRIIQLLPINPVPTTYARMGRFGSPYATLDFKNVDPALTVFDRQTTPMDQFVELADAIHARNAKLFIDIPVNHTGWASELQLRHPEWFCRNSDGSFESPGAWGVTWEDLSKLNYGKKELWKYMAGVFLFWCERGVDGFRCDAGYMLPYEAWVYIIAKVRSGFPDTVFFLEGLGGLLSAVERLLADADLDWAYSELFQNYDQHQIEHYLPGAINLSMRKGLNVHFAETHDNNRLAAQSHEYSKMRVGLSAMVSHDGAFGITNGVEWFAKEKIDVHESRPMNWKAEVNQVDYIARLNAILETNDLFTPGTSLRMIQRNGDNGIALLRYREEKKGLVLVNLNDNRSCTITWSTDDYNVGDGKVYDLISGRELSLSVVNNMAHMTLSNGEVLFLTEEVSDLDAIKDLLRRPHGPVEKSLWQRMQSHALAVYSLFKKGNKYPEHPDVLSRELHVHPRKFLDMVANDGYVPVVKWAWPYDLHRTVMLPPDHLLLIKAQYRFDVTLLHEKVVIFRAESLPTANGLHFLYLLPREAKKEADKYRLRMTLYEPNGVKHGESDIVYLPNDAQKLEVRKSFEAFELINKDIYAIITNDHGAMAQVRGAWGSVDSLYDSFLAGNLHASSPSDRHIMFTRCRGWLLYKGYYQELNLECMKDFSVIDSQTVLWRFDIPVGCGQRVPVEIALKIHPEKNAVFMEICRPKTDSLGEEWLDEHSAIKLIFRPDIEDRLCHVATKAYAGPENWWPDAVRAEKDGFVFAPAGDRCLEMSITAGKFTHESEWQYCIDRPFERGRGLESSSDLFSPGYFTVMLRGGNKTGIKAEMTSKPGSLKKDDYKPGRTELDRSSVKLLDAARESMRQFIVNRDDSRTVLAGFPWFLDWGRDTLICLRGMISAGFLKESLDILKQFARFEWQGTLPNMIRGDDVSNRDTSDAPLWFFTACADYEKAVGNVEFLKDDCGGRPLKEVLISIARFYMSGTPNGIKMDEKSGLIYSPSHFTWMDTNYPACTPRTGYPIEIQALWYAAVIFLAAIDKDGGWRELAENVRNSLMKHFWNGQYFADCLHAGAGIPAENASVDDAIRPNQLLVVTLGAVDDPGVCKRVIATCEALLVPGGIRSLADRPVSHPIHIQSGTKMLNDPYYPYWGHYEGDEDTRRKPAYHNGTAWSWMFPSYSEALCMVYGKDGYAAAKAILASSVLVINCGCVGHVPEIMDGNTPHIWRGCGAQAWGVTELYRVLAFYFGEE